MPEPTNPHVKLAFDTIKAKKPLYDELYRYYTGFHPLRYSTQKLKDVFEAFNVYFSENWIGVIVDAVIDRLILKGFDVSNNTEAKTKLDDMWRNHNIMLIAEDVHEAVTITNEGFVIAMKTEEEDTTEQLEIFFNDPRMCHMFYDANSPNKKEFAAKLWQDNEGFIRLTLYYIDRFEHYKSQRAMKPGQSVSTYKLLLPDPELPTEDNPFEVIPVFHWVTSRTTRKRDIGPSETSMQDAINKLFSDMMVSSEFNSFVQRIIISKADPGNMPNTPGANWWIPAGSEGDQGTSVTELGGRVLDGFLNAIDKLATSLAIISRTPKHYFFSQGGDPSGEALIAMESPLTKKVKKRQNRYSVEWQALAQFLLELDDISIERNQIVPTWEPAETVQPMTSATITKTQVDSGVPLKTSLRWQGKTENDIKQLEEDQKEEQKKRSGLAQDALDQLRAQDANSNTNSGGDTNAQA